MTRTASPADAVLAITRGLDYLEGRGTHASALADMVGPLKVQQERLRGLVIRALRVQMAREIAREPRLRKAALVQLPNGRPVEADKVSGVRVVDSDHLEIRIEGDEAPTVIACRARSEADALRFNIVNQLNRSE